MNSAIEMNVFLEVNNIITFVAITKREKGDFFCKSLALTMSK